MVSEDLVTNPKILCRVTENNYTADTKGIYNILLCGLILLQDSTTHKQSFYHNVVICTIPAANSTVCSLPCQKRPTSALASPGASESNFSLAVLVKG